MYRLHSDRDFEFVKESANELHEFDVKSYKYASNLIFEGVPASLAEMPIITDGADGVSIIEAALADLNKVSAENSEPLISFYQRANLSPFLDKSNIVITIPNLGEVDKIRPQFLIAEAKGISEYIAKFLSGAIPAKELMYQVDKLSMANSKKNISKTILDTSKDITYLARQVQGENVYVDGNFIRTRVVPFLATYPATQAMLTKEATAVIAAIKDSTAVLTQTIAAVNEAIAKMDKLKALKVSQYMYKITRKYIELRSYTAFIMTRKLLNYTHTMLQFYNLYTLLVERFPEGSRVLHENVIDGELSIDVEDFDLVRDMQSANGSLVDTKIDSIVNRRGADIANASRQLNGTDALNQIGISYCDYNKEIYEAIKSIFTSFNSRIIDFKNAIMNGEIFDDAQAHTGFDGNLTLKYNSTIANFSSVEASDFGHDRTPSTVPIDLAVNAFGEIKAMSRNFGEIRSEMQAADATINGIKQDFEDAKTTQTEVSVETLNEALEFITKLYEQFQHLVADVTKAAFQRAVALDDMIEQFLTEQTTPQGTVTMHEAELPSFNDVYDYIEEAMREDETLEMAKEYFTLRNLHCEGVSTIFEAETSTSTATSPGSGTGTGSASSGGTQGGLASKLIKWIKEFFKGFMRKITSTSGEATAFLNEFEDAILAIPEDQIVSIPDIINIFNINPTNIISAINETCGKVRTTVYKQFKPDTIVAEIFPEQVIPKGKEILSEKTKNFYLNGGDGTTKEEVPANVISSNRKAMIDYCRQFENTVSEINRQYSAACDALDEKINADGFEKIKQETPAQSNLSSSQQQSTTQQTSEVKTTTESLDAIAELLAYSLITESNKGKTRAKRERVAKNASQTQSQPNSNSSGTTIKAGQSEADKRAEQESSSGANDNKDEELKILRDTYTKVVDEFRNYCSGSLNALSIRMNMYYDILRVVLRHTLKDDRPSSINRQVNKYKLTQGLSFYGSIKRSDTTWDCYFYGKDSGKNNEGDKDAGKPTEAVSIFKKVTFNTNQQ